MPPIRQWFSPDLDVHIRRAVWITYLVTMVGAAQVYAFKAEEERSAFVRWRHQVLELFQGRNIYYEQLFPNPPIMPVTLYPLMALPPVAGAVAWFAIKAALTAASTAVAIARADEGQSDGHMGSSPRGSVHVPALSAYAGLLSA